VTQNIEQQQTLVNACFMLISFLSHSLTLKIEVTCSSKTSVGFQCNGDEPYSSIKCWAFLDWLSNYWLLKKDSAPYTLIVSAGFYMSSQLFTSLLKQT
jgi:hypothetical protein